MNGRYFTGEPIEQRLDRLIDALNSGNVPDDLNRDSELNELAHTLYATESVREVQWPDAGFDRHMAARLSAELRAPSHPMEAHGDLRRLDVPTSAAGFNGHNAEATGDRSTFELTHAADQRRFRRFAQIAAAVAGFALLTYILATVFSGYRENQSIGIAPVSGDQQIAFVKDVPVKQDNEEFLANPDGNAEIYLANGDGSAATNLTNHPADDRAPAWSPDGQTLAFASNRTGHYEIFIMDADGGNVRQLTNNNEPSDWPVWSPDGTSIAYVARVNGIDSPWIMNPDGTGQAALPNASESDAVRGPFEWSPDGSLIAYTYDSGELGIGVSAASGSRSRLVQILGEDIRGISWSPDGSKLAFAPFGDADDIAYVDATNILDDEQFEPVLVTESAAGEKNLPRWSPADNQIVYMTSYRAVPAVDTEQGLFMADLATGESRQLSPELSDRYIVHIRWSPNGESLALLRRGDPRTNMEDRRGTGDTFDVVLIDAEGSNERVIADDIWSVWNDPPAWRPSESEDIDNNPEEPVVTMQELPQPTATLERGSSELVPTPPSTPNASLAVVPFQLACEGSAAVSGSGFIPGSTVDIFMGGTVPDAPDGSAILSTTASDDGTFQFDELVPIATLIPDCEERAANGNPDLTFSAASVIEIDGEQRYAEPFAQTPAWLASATSTSQAPPGVTFAVDPSIGSCDSTVAVSGSGFEPGSNLSFFVFEARSDSGAAVDPRPTVGDDGNFSAELDLAPFIGCNMEREIPEAGILYRISVQTGLGPKENDPFREPSASAYFTLVPGTGEVSPETLDNVMVGQATEAAGSFLNEPDAAFAVTEINRNERYVRINRQVGDAYDEFTYDVDLGAIVFATIQGHTSSVAPVEPINSDRAMEIAESMASQTYPGFDQLELHDTSADDVVPGPDGMDSVFTATWQLLVNESVWVPTTLTVNIDLDTGRIVGFSFVHEPYRGSLEPQIEQSNAEATVKEAIAIEPTLADATIGSIELTTAYQVLEMDDNGSVVSGEWILVWRIYLENAPESAPGPYVDVNALTGELLTDFGEPGGAG